MKKQYNAWITLCGQTGVGLNEATQTITLDLERWNEYLKGHPEAKIFRSRPLSFSDEMRILFGGTKAREEETWTPSFGFFPEDLNTHIPSPPPHVDNTHNHVQEEIFEDISIEELMTSARRKRPCPSRSRRDVRNNKYDENMERLVIILEEDKKEEDRKKKSRKNKEERRR
ncbi:L10-interacting MYB domain-containing-like protein isoform X1 [Cinnamomum micranthum f. kanehirae]|uniref:L10-interacting MYB domain-containing-like protein isoform X1 n=1 Tax=Cinnamomum micranthum f. kanehirae TaxID=337451 RepID=A0A443NCA0_9MAGN|nr:L10-interacting MYB domain-containing-like protein isoform X1 [Cinnamomum micranthum f. kanehirae]